MSVCLTDSLAGNPLVFCVAMSSLDDLFGHYLTAHQDLFAHYNDLVGRLSDEQMAVQSLCPDWDVRGVINHAIGAEYWMTGWVPSGTAPPPFERFVEFDARARGASPSEFAQIVAETTATRLDDLRALGPRVLDLPACTPAGLFSYGRFLQVRVFDLWVHARDIAIPLGETLDDSGFSAEASLQEVDDSIGYIVGKKIGLPDSMSIAFRIRGAVDRDILVRVDGRAARVSELADPEVEVFSDVCTFVMLAAGRIDPQQQIDANKISWSGDPHWGETAARNLAYTQ